MAYLQQHFRNQRYYCQWRVKDRKTAAGAKGKGKGKAVGDISDNDKWDVESGIDTGDEIWLLANKKLKFKFTVNIN